MSTISWRSVECQLGSFGLLGNQLGLPGGRCARRCLRHRPDGSTLPPAGADRSARDAERAADARRLRPAFRAADRRAYAVGRFPGARRRRHRAAAAGDEREIGPAEPLGSAHRRPADALDRLLSRGRRPAPLGGPTTTSIMRTVRSARASIPAWRCSEAGTSARATWASSAGEQRATICSSARARSSDSRRICAKPSRRR